MIVWTCAVRSGEAAIQYRKGTGTDTTHWRVGTQGMTHSTRWAAVWAIRRAAHDGQKPRRLQLKGSSSSFGHVSGVFCPTPQKGIFRRLEREGVRNGSLCQSLNDRRHVNDLWRPGELVASTEINMLPGHG